MNGLGSQQSRVLALIEKHGSYRCETAPEQNAARKLNGKGIIRRDMKDGFLWYAAADRAPSEEGGEGGPDAPETGVDRLPQVVEATEIAVPRHDASDLLATVERARKLLDDGDVIAARMLASVAYDQAKLVAQYGERFKAAEKLVSKARQMQADALLIETRAKIGIARQWDAATEAGQTLKGARKAFQTRTLSPPPRLALLARKFMRLASWLLPRRGRLASSSARFKRESKRG